jgi:hypothetical protein
VLGRLTSGGPQLEARLQRILETPSQSIAEDSSISLSSQTTWRLGSGESQFQDSPGKIKSMRDPNSTENS